VPDAVVVDALSNGDAAARAAQGRHDAAICTPFGLSRAGLVAIAKDIADRPDAQTRFVLLARPGRTSPPTGHHVTTLAVSIAHDRTGALLAVLAELAIRGINLTHIESRPTGEQLGRYTFFLDCAGHITQARLGEAVRGLWRICTSVRFLGSYPRSGTAGLVAAPSGTAEHDFAEASAWLARVLAGKPG
jgi:prephenate dehydratase